MSFPRLLDFRLLDFRRQSGNTWRAIWHTSPTRVLPRAGLVSLFPSHGQEDATPTASISVKRGDRGALGSLPLLSPPCPTRCNRFPVRLRETAEERPSPPAEARIRSASAAARSENWAKGRHSAVPDPEESPLRPLISPPRTVPGQGNREHLPIPLAVLRSDWPAPVAPPPSDGQASVRAG